MLKTLVSFANFIQSLFTQTLIPQTISLHDPVNATTGQLVPSRVSFSSVPYDGIAQSIVGNVGNAPWRIFGNNMLLDDSTINAYPNGVPFNFNSGDFIFTDDWSSDVIPGELIFQGFHVLGDGLDHPIVPSNATNIKFIVRVKRHIIDGNAGNYNSVVDRSILMYVPDVDGDSINKSNTGPWSTIQTCETYDGGDWGLALTGTDITTNTGLAISPDFASNWNPNYGGSQACIDDVTLEVRWNGIFSESSTCCQRAFDIGVIHSTEWINTNNMWQVTFPNPIGISNDLDFGGFDLGSLSRDARITGFAVKTEYNNQTGLGARIDATIHAGSNVLGTQSVNLEANTNGLITIGGEFNKWGWEEEYLRPRNLGITLRVVPSAFGSISVSNKVTMQIYFVNDAQ